MKDLPVNHEQRFSLTNEVHARPPVPLEGQVHLSCIALTTNWPYRDEDRALVAELTSRYGATPPGPGVKHYSVDLKDFHLIWERHTEFTRYTFMVKASGEPFDRLAIDAAPKAWIQSLPGKLMVAAHATLLPVEDPESTEHTDIAESYFSGNALIGASIAGGAATAVTDFRLHADGFSRFLILNKSMTPWHAGRIVQRLLEIETYRIMALLALPVAQQLAQGMKTWEQELSEITAAMTEEAIPDEPALLDRLTTLQAQIERSYSDSQFRFGAADAYYALVQRRISELREDRLSDMQTFNEFTERRLAPAMNTCMSISSRLEGLSERVDRAAQLLSTRVDMSLERQNQAVLESMNQRAELQLRLQQTVEGLSIAAITYYTVGVIGYVASGLVASGVGIDPDLVKGISVPIVLAAAAAGVWHTRRRLHAAQQKAPKDKEI